jgi:hypothetical protein
MSGSAVKSTRRALRRMLGAKATTTVIDTAYDFQRFRERGFFARFRWLLFGR